MPEQPPLPFPPPQRDERPPAGPAPRPRPEGPGPGLQQERLGPAFTRLKNALRAERVSLTDEPEAAPPEYVLVLEIAGELDDFMGAVSRVEGLEYLADELGTKLEDVDTFAAVDQDGRRKPLRRELFLVATDERAATELERLWDSWQRGEAPEWGWTLWRTVFERLNTVRRWNDRDRLERTGAAHAWEAELADLGNELVPFEVELWFRASDERRAREADRLQRDVERVGGRVLDRYEMPEISYHGVLAEAPAALLLETAQSVDASWISGNGVRFFRATGQASFAVAEEPELAPPFPAVPTPTERPAPRAALFDGLPVAGHELLSAWVVVDDPDGWEETTEVRHRRHGTAMASAILNGDLGAGVSPLDEALYIRPIIRVDPRHSWVPDAQETVPVERLPVRLIHEAVARMFEGEEPQAADVRIINLSVADKAQSYDQFVSPWARLLDHLSFMYNVLFIVSAGNHDQGFSVSTDVDVNDSAELTHEVLGQAAQTALLRRLLAPAESVNALTVGAAHADAANVPHDGRTDPLTPAGLPAPCSSWGPGHGRAIKPDLLAPGGRQLYDLQPRVDGEPTRRLTGSLSARAPGIQVATAGRAGELSATTWITGTSPAAALTTRAGVQILQLLDRLRTEWDRNMPGPEFDAVLVKALLVHGASWGDSPEPLREAMRDAQIGGTKEDVQRALGYGTIRPDWATTDDDHRGMLLFADRLADGIHQYRLPLPPSLAGQTAWRRIAATLAWLTPVNPTHRGYRRAALKVDARGSVGLATNRQEASNQSVARGTVQHEILEGRNAVPFVDGDDLVFTVTGRPGAGTLAGPVPYAFVVTLETAPDLGLPIQSEIHARIRQRVARVRATP